MSSKEWLKTYYNCLIVCVILWIWGMVMVMSSSTPSGIQNTGNAFYYFERQVIFFVLGLGLFMFFRNFQYQKLKKFSKPLILFSFLLLTGVIVLGHVVKGARRDIGFGSIGFQPSELAKVAFIIYLADFFSRKYGKQMILKDFTAPLVVLIFMMLLLIKEPDFGSTVLVFLYAAGLLFLAGINLKILFGFIGSFIPLAAVLIAMAPYRMKRIIGFLHPNQHPYGIGYQIIQSLISLGSGGIFGVGIGNGKQKLAFLPEAYKDYVFAIIGEETGLIGTLGVIVLFAILVLICLKVSRKTKDPFGKYLASGIGLYFGCQVILNIGVVIDLLPSKGTTLPFFSYGGSSLVMSMATLGVLFNLIKNLRNEEDLPFQPLDL
ncbi:MAG: putative lipid II flippase FtsW [Candidatus Omnitrophica bacterium]|nr:putative lipid II flippase FtsW [Candidatus Omnitrophota bacterium]